MKNLQGFGHDQYYCQPHPGGRDISDNNSDGGREAMLTTYGKKSDGGREAILTRYRETKRIRKLMLSKKIIRYQIRKINSEKMPWLNGRFAKMT